ncbi:MAG: DUF1080 domain-containing protein [Lentisphaeria bacterium]|nr:DUF1080 domain-containing protein [Lentisphaeria bacterium]
MRPFLVSVLGLVLSAFAGADTVALCNGVDLGGWQCKPEASADHWRVEDGQIVGENADSKGSVLWTTSEYTDFDLELEFLTPSIDYDSGVFVRGTSHQVQIGISRSLKKDLTGCIYAPKDKAGSYPAVSDKVATVHQPGQWNTLRVVLRGKRMQTFLNGEAFVDYEGRTIPERGPIGLQLHGGVHMRMQFRSLRLQDLGVSAPNP